MVKKKAKAKTVQKEKPKSQNKDILKGKETKKENESKIVRLPANRPGVKTKEPKTKELILGTALLIIILISVYMIFFYQPYTFTINSNGITYYSNTYTPTTFFSEFSKNQEIYISPVMSEKGMDNLVANSMNLWLVVLAGNQINPIQLVRVENDLGELQYCYTNKGDVKTSEELNVEECNQLINNPENAVVLIEINGTNTVYMEPNKLTVYAENKEVISQVNLFVIKKGFPNAEDIILAVNTGIAKIG